MSTPSSPSQNLQDLLRQSGGQLWRGRPETGHRRPALPTGHARLDQALPDGGWPLGAVTELLLPPPLQQAMWLLLPALCRQNREGRWLALINPPAIPYAPGLAQAGIDLNRLVHLPGLDNRASWWALEQLVQHSACGVALAWANPPEPAALRRLQLAVERGGGMAVLCRSHQAAREASTAALRLRLHRDRRIDILKARGNLRLQQLCLD